MLWLSCCGNDVTPCCDDLLPFQEVLSASFFTGTQASPQTSSMVGWPAESGSPKSMEESIYVPDKMPDSWHILRVSSRTVNIIYLTMNDYELLTSSLNIKYPISGCSECFCERVVNFKKTVKLLYCQSGSTQSRSFLVCFYFCFFKIYLFL